MLLHRSPCIVVLLWLWGRALTSPTPASALWDCLSDGLPESRSYAAASGLAPGGTLSLCIQVVALRVERKHSSKVYAMAESTAQRLPRAARAPWFRRGSVFLCSCVPEGPGSSVFPYFVFRGSPQKQRARGPAHQPGNGKFRFQEWIVCYGPFQPRSNVTQPNAT